MPGSALADAEIEPAARQKIDGRRLLGEQHWIVPGQHQHRGAEPERACFRREPRQQGQTRRNLPGSAEMMLDQEGRVIAQRFSFDVVVDELLVAEAGIHIRAAVAGGGAAEQSKTHQAGSITVFRGNVAGTRGLSNCRSSEHRHRRPVVSLLEHDGDGL